MLSVGGGGALMQIPLGFIARAVALSADGNQATVLGTDGGMYTVDTVTGAVTLLGVGVWPSAAAQRLTMSPDGTRVVTVEGNLVFVDAYGGSTTL